MGAERNTGARVVLRTGGKLAAWHRTSSDLRDHGNLMQVKSWKEKVSQQKENSSLCTNPGARGRLN